MTAPLCERFLAGRVRLEATLEKVYAAFAADDGEDTAKAWTEFEVTLFAHLEAVEAQLFPPLLRAAERDARLLFHEHRYIRSRVAELGTMLELRALRLESIRNFIDELRAHGQSEDRLLRRWADRDYDEPPK